MYIVDLFIPPFAFSLTHSFALNYRINQFINSSINQSIFTKQPIITLKQFGKFSNRSIRGPGHISISIGIGGKIADSSSPPQRSSINNNNNIALTLTVATISAVNTNLQQQQQQLHPQLHHFD